MYKENLVFKYKNGCYFFLKIMFVKKFVSKKCLLNFCFKKICFIKFVKN